MSRLREQPLHVVAPEPTGGGCFRIFQIWGRRFGIVDGRLHRGGVDGCGEVLPVRFFAVRRQVGEPINVNLYPGSVPRVLLQLYAACVHLSINFTS